MGEAARRNHLWKVCWMERGQRSRISSWRVKVITLDSIYRFDLKLNVESYRLAKHLAENGITCPKCHFQFALTRGIKYNSINYFILIISKLVKYVWLQVDACTLAALNANLVSSIIEDLMKLKSLDNLFIWSRILQWMWPTVFDGRPLWGGSFLRQIGAPRPPPSPLSVLPAGQRASWFTTPFEGFPLIHFH